MVIFNDAVLGSNLAPPTKKATLLGGFVGGEGEIFARQAVCTVATGAFAFPCPTELGQQKPSCCHSKNLPFSAPGGGRFFSISHRYAVLGSNLAPPTKKATLSGGFVGGEGEIRTLEPLLTVTRFPIVRARPATRLLRNCSAQFLLFNWRLKYNTTKKAFCQ